MYYEVSQGRLRIDGRDLPLRKGLLYRALGKAGWRGEDGVLPDDLARRLLRDPRVGLAAKSRPGKEGS